MASGRESPLLIQPIAAEGEYVRVTPESAGWDRLHFGARRMRAGEKWSQQTGDSEMCLVALGGTATVRSNRGDWQGFGRRPDVFSGLPYALYLPPGTDFNLEAVRAEFDVAYGWCQIESDHPPALIRPEDVEIEIRGGGNATRQINNMIPPGFNCGRLVVVEVYTPSGNWSSYPPHKHDRHKEDDQGHVLEADLEEVYFYKIDRPEGYAIQQIYTDDRSLDELILARNDDLVLVPEGYHPVVSAHGYTTYYLNFLAGSAQSLANTDDPDFAWVKETWADKDPRLPLVGLGMEASSG